MKLLLGVGINDADYKVHKGPAGGPIVICPLYRAWRGMIGRCYSESYAVRFPNYADCTVTPEWHRFSAFRAWMLTQDWEGKQLDKDLFVQSNKLYGPGTCVFISGAINTFLIDRKAKRGDWPLGVTWDKAVCKFRAQCRNPFTGKTDYLGIFTDPNEAHEAWRVRKLELAGILGSQQGDPRVAAALTARYQKGLDQTRIAL